jgi:hypothetical protein
VTIGATVIDFLLAVCLLCAIAAIGWVAVEFERRLL